MFWFQLKLYLPVALRKAITNVSDLPRLLSLYFKLESRLGDNADMFKVKLKVDNKIYITVFLAKEKSVRRYKLIAIEVVSVQDIAFN